MNFLIKNKYSILKKVLQYGFVFIALFSIFINSKVANGLIDTGVVVQTSIDNPIRCDTVSCFIDEIIGIVLVIGIPIVALAIIFSGFLFVQAQGSPDKLKTAKTALLYTLIGAALLLGAFVLSEAIQGTVDQLK